MIVGRSIDTSANCWKNHTEKFLFLEPYQKHKVQAATFVAHIKDGVKVAAKVLIKWDALVLLLSLDTGGLLSISWIV
ncbi:hypothetical protein DsansV1_C19g0158321 [Dioscorea sansibarensis]